MTHTEVSILFLCDHDRDSSFSGEPCCSCLLQFLLAKDLLGLLTAQDLLGLLTAQDVLVLLIAKALKLLLVALGLLELLFAEDLTELPILAFTLSSLQWGTLPNPTYGEAFSHAKEHY